MTADVKFLSNSVCKSLITQYNSSPGWTPGSYVESGVGASMARPNANAVTFVNPLEKLVLFEIYAESVQEVFQFT